MTPYHNFYDAAFGRVLYIDKKAKGTFYLIYRIFDLLDYNKHKMCRQASVIEIARTKNSHLSSTAGMFPSRISL